jgi:glycosyltransferase involved in cell wall biosynthesis
MDELWVPSIFGKKLMQKSNIYPPIYIMPLGVDVDRYKPNCGFMDFGSSMRKFKFLCVSKYSIRKGFDILLKAFLEEFSNEEDVTLLLVTNPLQVAAGQKGTQLIVEDFNNLKQYIKKPEQELPHVALYTKPINERDMPKIYNSCNAFVLISRGEGFSLTVLEAAACGLPVIASNVTAHTDFLNNNSSFLVEPDGFREAKISGHLSGMAKLCRFYEDQLFPDFSETGIEQTRKHMRFVYENYKVAKDKSEKLRNLIVNNYTWNMAIDKVYNRIRELAQ